MQTYGVAPQTVVNAINALRTEGLVLGLPGSGWYVRRRRPVMRMARSRLSQAERRAGRGTFTTDAHTGGWTPRVEVTIRVEPANEEVAEALGIEPGTDVLVRDRLMFADEEPVQLAVSYFPRELTEGTPIEQENTGPGGVYARLEDMGHRLSHFEECVRIGKISDTEANQLGVPTGTAVYRIARTAYTDDRAVEINYITALGESYELYYELKAE
jgi:GntR family transcriptional regulator